jgi:hypothetical protein
MTPGEVLIPAAVAMVFVVAWAAHGLVDAFRSDGPAARPAAEAKTPDEKQLAHHR